MEAIIPALIASIVGYSIFGAWSGWNPIFASPANLAFSSPPQLLYYVVLGLLCGGIGLLYTRGFYGITRLFHGLRLPRWLNPAIGGFLVGLIGLVIPQALGMGYGWVQISMGKGLLDLPLWIILALPLTKIVTTGLSIGSGGIFGPGMVIGGMTGALLWRLCYPVFPGLPDTPGPFVIVGMMALFGGIAHAPIAVMLMVAEMTGNLSLLAPAMIAVSLAYMLVGKNTIYTSQLATRADSPAHRLQFAFPLLSALTVRQAMSKPVASLRQTQSIAEAATILAEHDLRGAPVLSEEGELLGTLTKADIEQIPMQERAAQPPGNRTHAKTTASATTSQTMCTQGTGTPSTQKTEGEPQPELVALYEKYRRPLHTYIYRLLGSLEDADDVIQEVFFSAFVSWHRLSDHERLSSWLYRVATNLCMD